MKKIELAILVYIITISLSVMYATQPLQPLLARVFHVDLIQASAFTAVMLFSLAIAPIIYGYILESFSAKKMLQISTAVLFITNIFLGLSVNYEMFLAIRLIEGLVIPAILTSVMSILANLDKENVKFNMSLYVAATVFGGIVGRVGSGVIATNFGWRIVFISLSVQLLFALYFVRKIQYTGETKMVKAKLSDVLSILKDRRFTTVYLLMFTIFFVFGGLLNIIPFRMKEINPNSTEAQIGLMYLGYSTGIVVSLFSHKIVKFFKTEMRTIIVATLFFNIIVVIFVVKNITFIFLLLFLFCVGMFTIHSISSGLANSIRADKRSITSGMYLTFYYIGGSLGSIFPAMIYQNFGWNTTIFMFTFILFSILMFVLYSQRYFKT
ncbi:MFS transporter [Sulfurospirillum sp. 1612]|uniref:MFS transporter n=1 Tax=Sulfurospirillum sp. 1612 TaxID=3094835 RepID=UPI002F958A1F